MMKIKCLNLLLVAYCLVVFVHESSWLRVFFLFDNFIQLIHFFKTDCVEESFSELAHKGLEKIKEQVPIIKKKIEVFINKKVDKIKEFGSDIAHSFQHLFEAANSTTTNTVLNRTKRNFYSFDPDRFAKRNAD